MKLNLPQVELTTLPSADFPKPIPRYVEETSIDLREMRSRPKVRGITIDGPFSKDLDDAIWLEKNDLGYLITISIADVSSVVKPYSYLDFEALHRATSIYFPDRVIPMLPNELSNGLLSLLPDRERPTLSVQVQLEPGCKIISSKIFKTRLISEARLIYGRMNKHWSFTPGVSLLDYRIVAKALQSLRVQQNEITFGKTQNHFGLDEDGHIHSGKNTEGHLIVQEFMILANQVIANFLKKNSVAAPFRNHTLLNGKLPTKQQFIDIIENSQDYGTIQTSLRELFQQYFSVAHYNSKSAGHAGLGLENYTHFTSPIRRYADLVVHRQVIDVLAGNNQTYSAPEIDHLSNYINARLRRIAVLRSTEELPNLPASRISEFNLESDQSLTLAEINGLNSLRQILQTNRLGNPRFEFNMEQGMNPLISCTVWIRYQGKKIESKVSGYSSKENIKAKAAYQLYKNLSSLVVHYPLEENSSKQSISREPTEDPVLLISRYTTALGLPKPVYLYENWAGSKTVSCNCYINDQLTAVSSADTFKEAKSKSAVSVLKILS